MYWVLGTSKNTNLIVVTLLAWLDFEVQIKELNKLWLEIRVFKVEIFWTGACLPRPEAVDDMEIPVRMMMSVW